MRRTSISGAVWRTFTRDMRTLRSADVSSAKFRMSSSLDLQKQRDKFALAMCVRLRKDRFQLIARRLP
jgi:hypothetical protein